MNLNEYIASGILTDYCLGLLDIGQRREVEMHCRQYPELQKEVDDIKLTLEKYLLSQSEPPAETLKDKIWQTISSIRSGELNYQEQLPVLTRYSEKETWLALVKPMLPATLQQDLFVKVMRDDEELMQTVLWTKVNYPDEVHDDLHECFMILEGECECYVGDKVIRLSAGDYFDVPLHAHHDVKILSKEVLAVVQRRKIA